MARRNNRPARKTATKSATTVRVSRPEEKTTESDQGLFEKIQYDLQHNQSYLNLILGGLIIVVLAVLVYNYFNRPSSNLEDTQITEPPAQVGDVLKENLPGEYTIKEGDTLFTIAQKYYDDGYKYTDIVKANNMQNENAIEVGQKIIIPAPADASASPMASAAPEASVAASASPMASIAPSLAPSMMPTASPAMQQTNQVAPGEKGATGGAENATTWGDRITTDTYTVQAGDWLSKIAGRAYGDVMAYQRIAAANNISNPDAIEVGTVLRLPR